MLCLISAGDMEIGGGNVGDPLESWGFTLPSGTRLRIVYDVITDNYLDDEGYSIAERVK